MKEAKTSNSKTPQIETQNSQHFPDIVETEKKGWAEKNSSEKNTFSGKFERGQTHQHYHNHHTFGFEISPFYDTLQYGKVFSITGLLCSVGIFICLPLLIFWFLHFNGFQFSKDVFALTILLLFFVAMPTFLVSYIWAARIKDKQKYIYKNTTFFSDSEYFYRGTHNKNFNKQKNVRDNLSTHLKIDQLQNLTKSKATQKYKVSEIREIQIFKAKKEKFYELNIVMHNALNLNIANYEDQEEMQHAAEELRTFLDLPIINKIDA